MAVIFETNNFTVDAPDYPHIDRSDGGHIIIFPKVMVRDRQQLSSLLAIELMRLTTVVGEAMASVMNKRGVNIGRINYQDNGNWAVFAPEGPSLHIHLYGRAKSAQTQPYGQSLVFPHIDEHPEFYKDFQPLNPNDIFDIRNEALRLFTESRYSDETWHL